MQTFLTYLPVIKDIVTILATATAAVVAVIGLQTWKRQIRGNAEYDLARRVLIAVYRVREAISQYLSMVKLEDWIEKEERPSDKNDKYLDDVRLERTKFDVEFLEAQAVWGDDAELIHTLAQFSVLAWGIGLSSIDFTRDDTHPGKFRNIQIKLEKQEEANKNMYKIYKSVRDIEDFLRPKLKLKQGKRRQWKIFRKKSKS